MKRYLSSIGIGLLLVTGLVCLYLTNTGVLRFNKPYVYQLADELPHTSLIVAFENVSLVPMDSERIVENQTVIVREGQIETIGHSDHVSIPDEALVIDGQGKYLMPGLVDMHVHIEYENDMLLMVSNGVTSVRNMWGNSGKKLRFGMPDQMELRHGIEDGTIFGPTIYSAGPVMEGSPASHPLMEVYETPESARESVAWQVDQGYDFIKVYDHLKPEVYKAIMETADQEGIEVVGHVPFAVGLDNVLDSGQVTIEHLTGYIDPDTVEFLIPADQLDEYAQKTREAGVWNCATLSYYPKSKQTPEGFQRLQDQAGIDYLSPGTRLFSPFLYMMSARSHSYQGADYPERIADLNRQMVVALHAAGAGILLCTDAAQAYHLPGYATHEELEWLVEAGLSPYEALEAGTRNAALVLGKLDEFGTVEEGKRADLILLDENPLRDVRNLEKRQGVMLRGRWLAEKQLRGMLDSLVLSYQPGVIDRIWPLALVGLAVWLIVRRISRRVAGES